MILAISQDAASVSIAVGSNGSFTADDLLDYTFDTIYASSTVSLNFFIDLDAQNTTYVGIAGHNLGTIGASIDILNHDTVDVASFAPVDDRPIMLEIPARTGGAVNKVRIRIVKQNATDVAIVSHTATGLTTDFTSTTTNGQIITKDYSAGYPRIPMNRARKSKAILNDAAAPTATLIKTISQKVRLNIPDVATNFAQDELLEYQTFWTENAFFIQNDDDYLQTYMAMQFIPIAPSSHSSTRELVNLSYSFTAYNGL